MDNWLPLLGVVIAQFVLLGLYLLKQRADDRRRWHDRRLDAYRELSGALRDTYQALAHRLPQNDFEWIAINKALARAEACELDIDLLASERVRDTAGIGIALIESLVVLDPVMPGFPKAEDFIRSRGEFIEAVRAELNVRSPRALRSGGIVIEPPDPDSLD